MILSRVLESARRQGLLRRGDGVLVGCSGGPDSTALLHLLCRARRRLDLRLVAAYVHHGLRPEADAEAEHVTAFAASLGIAAEVLRVQVPRRASLQEAARRVRLRALAERAAELGLERVALAHTRTDQAETVLMRVLRGTGPRGLAAIPPRRGALTRPLLGVGRDELEAYLRKRGLSWIEDPSNLDRRYLRTRVRTDVMPLLRALNPRVEEALARLADNAREERGEAVSPPLSRSHLRALAEILDTEGGTRWLSLPGGRVAEVRVLPGRPARAAAVEVEVRGPGRYRVPELGAVFRLGRGATRGDGPSASFDPTALAFPLTLRTRRLGDRIRLEQGTKKISDVLIDAKIPRRDRERVLLLCRGPEVLWVAGVRQAAGTRPRGAVRLVAKIGPNVDPAPDRANNGV